MSRRQRPQGANMDQSSGGPGDCRSDEQLDQGEDQDHGRDQNPKYHLFRLTERFRRLRELSDPPYHWKQLYQQVFEYEIPLFQLAPRIFKFVKPKRSRSDNPWKESFQQLYHGLHVRPGYPENELAALNIRNFETIHDAINFTKNSDDSEVMGHKALIFVHAGIHKGEIVIDSNVALLGASAGVVNTSVILEGENESTLKFVTGADVACASFLTLKFTPRNFALIAENKGFCLEITSCSTTIRCSPTIHECIIENSSLETTAVRVSGEGAEPIIKKCVIRGRKRMGLIVEDNAQGTYKSNKIISNPGKEMTCRRGIWVKSMASPVVFDNVISGYTFGIKVSEEGSGVFEENRVIKNGSAAFKITKKGNPVVLHNILEDGSKAVVIFNEGFGLFLDNQINARLSVGILCSENSNPTIKRNRIHNGSVGVNITDDGKGWFQDNDIYDTSTGICIKSGNPIIIQNKIHHNRIGIRVVQKGRGHIVRNKICVNTLHGVRIETASTPFLQCNTIAEGQIGVHIQERSCGELEGNSIFDNDYNVKIESGSEPNIRENKISRGKQGGVLITNEGLGFLEENEIYENLVSGVCITEHSDPTLQANTIFDNTGYGVSVVNEGKGKLKNNKILRSSLSGVLISSQSNPILQRNEISYGRGAGVDITSDATATLEYNVISHNRFSGISRAEGAEVVMVDNFVVGNKDLEKKAVEVRKCLHSVLSGSRELFHDMYACATCVTKYKKSRCASVCVSCAGICHQGHAVSFVRRDKFRCACGAGELRNYCRLIGAAYWVLRRRSGNAF